MTSSTLGGAAAPDIPDVNVSNPAIGSTTSWHRAMAAKLVHALGNAVSHIADSDDFQWVAQSIESFFRRTADVSDDELSVANMLGCLRRAEDRKPTIDPVRFADMLSTVVLPKIDQDCAAIRNLNQIAATLHLTRAESALLEWTYGVWSDPTATLSTALMQMNIDSESNAHRMLASVLGVSEGEVALMLDAPCCLSAVGLVDLAGHAQTRDLSHYFDIAQPLLSLCESGPMTDMELLEQLRAPPPFWFLDPRHQIPAPLFYEWYAAGIADALASTARGTALTPKHISSCIAWWTGCVIPDQDCARLAYRMDLQAIRRAIASHSVDCCISRKTLSSDGIWKAISTHPWIRPAC
ncbi:MAG: hypothetical protein EOP24_19085 [Hyphomicrobiales bacterium]|nr:MAG: hypothetical protein EOP24_19085 [Hyphomicrobiales bacterium]